MAWFYNLLGTLTRGTNKLECLFEVNILSLFGIDAGLFAQQRAVELTAKWCLHRRENIKCCRHRQPFEKMGEFLLKSHRSHRV